MRPLKLLLSLIVIAIALAGCGGAEDRAAGYLEKAQQLLADENFVKAKIEAKNALQIDPNLVEAWMLLGKAQEKESDWSGAFGSYSKVLTLDENHLGATVRRGQIYLAARRLAEARKDAEKSLQLGPNDSGALLLNAGVLRAEGKNEESEGVARQALAADAGNQQARGFLALILAAQEKSDEALALIEQGLKLDPKSTYLHVVQVRIFQALKRPEDELASLRELVALEPEDANRVYALAASLNRLGRKEEVEQVLRDRLEAYPEEAKTEKLLAEFIAGNRELDVAEGQIKALIAGSKDPNKLRFILAKLYEKNKMIDDARSIYDAVIAEMGVEGDGLMARKRLAKIRVGEKDYAGARELFDQVLKENSRDGEALYGRAALMLREGKIEDAVTDLRVVIADRPNSLQVAELLVRAYLVQGKVNQATDQLERLLEVVRDQEKPYTALADLYSKLGQSDDVERVLKQMLDNLPNSIPALRGLTKLALQRQDVDSALGYAGQLQKIDPDLADGPYLAGLAHQVAGDHKAAIAAFRKALEIKPDAIEPLTSLVRSRIALGEQAQMRDELETLTQDSPEHFVAYNLLGELQVRESKLEAAEQAFRKASEINPRWVVPYVNLARMQQQQGRSDEVLATYKNGKKATEGDPVISVALGKFYEQNDQLDAARVEYEELMRRLPNALGVANHLAMLLTRNPDDVEGMDRALELATRFEKSTNPIYRDTLGWVLLSRGDLETGLKHLEFAAEAAPDNAEIQYHLGKAYKQAGRNTDAKIHLERAVASTQAFPGDVEAKRLLESL